MLPSQLSCIAHVVCWLWATSGSLAELRSVNFRRAASGRLPEVASVAILEKARSSLDCSRRCQWPACCSYGYSQTARLCRLFSASHLGGFQAAEGFDFFVGCPVSVGGGCTKDADCAGTANSECRSDVCQCKQGFRLDAGSAACVAIRVGDECSKDADCTGMANSECRNSICQCKQSFRLDSGSAACVAIRVGDECSKDADCTGMANSECRNSICQCKQSFHLDSGSAACVAILVGDDCENNWDCINTDNAECRYGTCQCVPGYYFYPGSDTCVAACPNGYGEDYYKVWDHHIDDYNSMITDGYQATEEECWQDCRKDLQCKSFEYFDDRCVRYRVTALHPSFQFYQGHHYYQGNCA